MIKIWHNPGCSKSNGICSLLKENLIDAEIYDFISEPPTKDELRQLLQLLQIPARELVRDMDNILKSDAASRAYSEEDWIEWLCRNPANIQRPVIVSGGRAIIGRPEEKVRDFLQMR